MRHATESMLRVEFVAFALCLVAIALVSIVRTVPNASATACWVLWSRKKRKKSCARFDSQPAMRVVYCLPTAALAVLRAGVPSPIMAPGASRRPSMACWMLVLAVLLLGGASRCQASRPIMDGLVGHFSSPFEAARQLLVSLDCRAMLQDRLGTKHRSKPTLHCC